MCNYFHSSFNCPNLVTPVIAGSTPICTLTESTKTHTGTGSIGIRLTIGLY